MWHTRQGYNYHVLKIFLCRIFGRSGVAACTVAVFACGASAGRCAASANASLNAAPPGAMSDAAAAAVPTGERATEVAARFFDPLLADAPNKTIRGTLLHQRGVLYLRSNDKLKAIRDFDEALTLLPVGHEESLDVLFHRACALLLLPKPDARGAIKNISACLAAEPNDPEALLVRANAYRLLGRKDLASADIDRAESLAPKSDTTIRALIQSARDGVR